MLEGDLPPLGSGSLLRYTGLGDSLDGGVWCKLGDALAGVIPAEEASAGDLGMRDPGCRGAWPPRGVSMLPEGDGSPPGLGSMDVDVAEGARSRLLVDAAELLCTDGASDPGGGRALLHGDVPGSVEAAVPPLCAAVRLWLEDGMASGATGCVDGRAGRCVVERAGR